MFLQTFYTPGLAINSYIVGDRSSGKAIVIDPVRHVEPYVAWARKEGVTITDILETHVHADFVSGSKELKHRLGSKPTIHCSSMGGKEWTPLYADKLIKDHDGISLGSVRLQAVHTPGHTPEHLIWLCFDEARSTQSPCLAFTGDLLFVGSVGRPDLLGKTEEAALARQLYQSLFTTLASLPDYLEIYPAHGAGSLCGKALSSRATSTLGYERLYNSMLQKKPMDEWVKALLKGMPAAPPHFRRMKKINVEGAALVNENKKEEGAMVVVDTRNPQEFAQAHFEGAINIPLGGSFCNWAGAFLDDSQNLVIVASSSQDLQDAAANLRLIGLDHISQMIVWTGESQLGMPIQQLPVVSVEQLDREIRERSPRIIDVRTELEWEEGHIPDAERIELPLIKDNLQKLSKDQPLYVICGSGYRSTGVSSFLRQQGFVDVHNVKGGMMAWNRANLPTSN